MTDPQTLNEWKEKETNFEPLFEEITRWKPMSHNKFISSLGEVLLKQPQSLTRHCVCTKRSVRVESEATYLVQSRHIRRNGKVIYTILFWSETRRHIYILKTHTYLELSSVQDHTPSPRPCSPCGEKAAPPPQTRWKSPQTPVQHSLRAGSRKSQSPRCTRRLWADSLSCARPESPCQTRGSRTPFRNELVISNTIVRKSNMYDVTGVNLKGIFMISAVLKQRIFKSVWSPRGHPPIYSRGFCDSQRQNIKCDTLFFNSFSAGVKNFSFVPWHSTLLLFLWQVDSFIYMLVWQSWQTFQEYEVQAKTIKNTIHSLQTFISYPTK
jgi:hypothetical protein